MLWLKILLACFTVAFSVGIGYLMADKYRCRYAFYRQFHDFNERYLAELAYARKPLTVFMGEFPASGEFAKLLKEWTQGHGVRCQFACLTSQECGQAEEYFSMLGRGDAQAQTAYFNAYKKTLSDARSACEKESRSRTALYLKLGLLAGLALVILMI